MDLDFRDGQDHQLNWDLTSDRKRSTDDRQEVLHLVFPRFINGDALDVLGSILAGGGDYIDCVHSFHPWDEPPRTMNCGRQGPNNRTELAIEGRWGISRNGERYWIFVGS